MTEAKFLSCIGMLFKYLRERPAQEVVNMYWELLKHMDEKEFEKAVTGVISEFIPTKATPFPLVAHFLKFSGSDANGRAIRAIATLKGYVRKIGKYESANFNDNALHATIERFGGWPAICAMGDTDWNVNEGRMIDTYKVMCAQYCDETNSHVAGLSEKDGGFYRVYNISQKTLQIDYIEKYRNCTCVGVLEAVKWHLKV
jgi:hypothetical protein